MQQQDPRCIYFFREMRFAVRAVFFFNFSASKPVCQCIIKCQFEVDKELVCQFFPTFFLNCCEIELAQNLELAPNFVFHSRCRRRSLGSFPSCSCIEDTSRMEIANPDGIPMARKLPFFFPSSPAVALVAVGHLNLKSETTFGCRTLSGSTEMSLLSGGFFFTHSSSLCLCVSLDFTPRI